MLKYENYSFPGFDLCSFTASSHTTCKQCL